MINRIIAAAATPAPRLFVWNGPRLTGDGSGALHTILSIIFGVMGGICLIIIVLAGLRMTLSSGNSEKISKERNTIIYAAIGLVVALSAATLVQFVIQNVK